jgi:hypothetical protein
MSTNPQYRHGHVVDNRRKRCPVCHEAVYSVAGIHPQCAIKIADGIPPGTVTSQVLEKEVGTVVATAKEIESDKIPPVVR